MEQYRRGRRSEYYIKNKLEDFGHKVYRLPGSKPVDLISFFEQFIWVHEVKRGNWDYSDVEKLEKEVERISYKFVDVFPVFWYKENGHWYHQIGTEHKDWENDYLP